MKLLLSNGEITLVQREAGYSAHALDQHILTARAQLNHIFNLDMKTTTEVIVKLQAHLDKLFLKEMAK